MYVLSGTVARFSIDDSGTRYVRTSGFADGVMFPIMGHIMARGVGNIADDTMLKQVVKISNFLFAVFLCPRMQWQQIANRGHSFGVYDCLVYGRPME